MSLFVRLKSTTAIYCPFCGSAEVEHEKPSVTNSYYRFENYAIKCNGCGATGHITERWDVPSKKDGDNDG